MNIGDFMNDKELRKISRKELLELLLEQAKKIEALEQELAKTKKKLDSKKITIDESGSIAEASLKLNNIFEIAQETAEQYLINIKEKCKKIENDTKKECQIQKDNMLKETLEKCAKREKEADEYLAKVEQKVKKITKNNKPTAKKSSNNKKAGTKTIKEKPTTDEIKNQTSKITKENNKMTSKNKKTVKKNSKKGK